MLCCCNIYFPLFRHRFLLYIGKEIIKWNTIHMITSLDSSTYLLTLSLGFADQRIGFTWKVKVHRISSTSFHFRVRNWRITRWWWFWTVQELDIVRVRHCDQDFVSSRVGKLIGAIKWAGVTSCKTSYFFISFLICNKVGFVNSFLFAGIVTQVPSYQHRFLWGSFASNENYGFGVAIIFTRYTRNWKNLRDCIMIL